MTRGLLFVHVNIFLHLPTNVCTCQLFVAPANVGKPKTRDKHAKDQRIHNVKIIHLPLLDVLHHQPVGL